MVRLFKTINYGFPNLANGSYYTLTGGNGDILNVEDVIITNQTIFIYNESSFNVEIIDIYIPSFLFPS